MFDFGEFLTRLLMAVTIIFSVLVMVGLIASIYIDAQSPTFSLQKSDWKCTKQHTELFCAKGCYTIESCYQWSHI